MSSVLSSADRERLETLFDRAADLPLEQHAAFVERECASNVALRDELSRLLRGLASEDILSRIQPEAPSRAGTTIGPYKLLERIGEGGMGEVYAAEQREPVARRVALKIIKPGMDSAQVVARFEAERQALARMSHPHVAQIFDGGATGDGRPYFVMELVQGAPITEYCDRHRLSTRERLKLFIDICDGVQHAHQKGIIHRDLKPSNLLVTAHDGLAAPKIIDFGVARATTGTLAKRTLHTMVGQIVGTLDYMSPEQADPTGVDIDTRSDVYSLGVVLYQLLSGLLPFEHESVVEQGLSEIQRTIREREPPTPSTRLKRQMETATAIAPKHGTDEHTLVRQLSGDLDWITLKALEKEPARRYASAHELAEDVRRYLAHEPVLAGRPGALYRVRKFVRRNRVAVVAGLLVFAALMAGLSGIVAGRLDALASARVVDALTVARDLVRTGELLEEADALFPPHPDLAEDMQAWLDSASELTAKLPNLRAELATMRADALPWSGGDRALDRSTHPRATELQTAEIQLERLADFVALGPDGVPGPTHERRLEKVIQAEQRIAATELEIEAISAEVDSRRTWRFPTFETEWRHGVLVDLIAQLEALQDTLLADDNATPEHGWSMPKRIRFAARLEQRSAEGEDWDRRWLHAIEAIGEHSAYGGLALSKQTGLVPIGADPDSGLWEFWHVATGEEPLRDANGRLSPSTEHGVVLVLIPGGTFAMGAQSRNPDGRNYDPQAQDWKESPVHDVSVDPFFLSKYEMSRAQWERQTYEVPGGQPNETRPADLVAVGGVDWSASAEVVRRAGLTLPHEEQWEYAARAGTTSVFSTGDDELSLQGYANLFDQSGVQAYPEWIRQEPRPSAIDDGHAELAPIGSFRPNPYGLHDVHGNIAEWCGNYPYAYAALGIPALLTARGTRGGSSRNGVMWTRSAARREGPPAIAGPTLGLRPARAVE